MLPPVLQSLRKWPPQPSTVIGLAAAAGVVVHLLSGNPAWDAAAAAVVAIMLPDNSAASDEVKGLIAAALEAIAKVRPVLLAALLLATGLGLSACQTTGSAAAGANAGTGTATGTGWQQALGQFTITDLDAAQADAKAHDDTVAATCYAALVPIVQNLAGGNPAAGVKGAFTVFQAARDLADAGKSATVQGLNVACAPLVLDSASTALGLAAKVGVTVAVPALPAL